MSQPGDVIRRPVVGLLGEAQVQQYRRRPMLGNVMGGLSGPAIKPLALRMVYQVARALPDTPLMGIGGIAELSDALEFLAAGASSVAAGSAPGART